MRTAPQPASRPLGGSFAANLRGFGPLGILSIVVIVLVGNAYVVPLGAILVLLWARSSHTPLRELGFTRPASWLVTVVLGAVLGVAFKLLMKTLVMPMLGAPPINSAYHDLVGNRGALPGAIYTMIVSAGFGEETVFRGFLFERFGRLLGSGLRGKTLTVLLTTGLFALVHFTNQGLAGVVQAAFTGLVFGTLVLITGRIWMSMVVHAAFDLTAVAIIYWNLETKLAHLLFK